MLLEDIKAQMRNAMKSGDVVAKEILRVAVGEITTEFARAGRKGDDEEAAAIVKRLIKSNDETLASGGAAGEEHAKLLRENEVLGAFLPKSLDVAAIVDALAGVTDAIKAAANDGQATGVAMKELKKVGAVVNGKDVSAAVKQLRG